MIRRFLNVALLPFWLLTAWLFLWLPLSCAASDVLNKRLSLSDALRFNLRIWWRTTVEERPLF